MLSNSPLWLRMNNRRTAITAARQGWGRPDRTIRSVRGNPQTERFRSAQETYSPNASLSPPVLLLQKAKRGKKPHNETNEKAQIFFSVTIKSPVFALL
jgi:hypothetical protein